MEARGSGKDGWGRPEGSRRAAEIPARGGRGPGSAARRGPGAVTAAPRAARGPFASRHLHPSACAAAAGRPHRAQGKKKKGEEKKGYSRVRKAS